jgi:hypothetical protein
MIENRSSEPTNSSPLGPKGGAARQDETNRDAPGVSGYLMDACIHSIPAFLLMMLRPSAAPKKPEGNASKS